MALAGAIEANGFVLNELENRRIRRSLAALNRRLVHRSEPAAVLTLGWHAEPRQAEASLREQLEPRGVLLVSHQPAVAAAKVARLAVAAIEPQLERHVAQQRGEATNGMPSRRRPEEHRIANTPGAADGTSPSV